MPNYGGGFQPGFGAPQAPIVTQPGAPMPPGQPMAPQGKFYFKTFFFIKKIGLL